MNELNSKLEPEIIIHHYPSNQNAENIRHFGIRNTLWTVWRRRSIKAALYTGHGMFLDRNQKTVFFGMGIGWLSKKPFGYLEPEKQYPEN